MKSAIFITLFLLSVLFNAAQSVVTINGLVLSGNSREALPGASITIYYQGKIAGLVANQEGRFQIPRGAAFDSLKFSMVGHYSKTLRTEQITDSGELLVSLDIAAASLPEVTLKPFTAIDLIQRVVAKLAVNQPSEDFENKGFYREIIRDKEHYFSIAEALFTAQFYPSERNFRLKLEQGRSKEEVSFTRLFEDYHPGGGPQGAMANGFIVDRPAFLDLKEIRKFNYRIDSLVSFDGRRLYHVSFDQKRQIKEALEKGYLLIDPEDDAVVEYLARNSPLGSPYIKSLSGTDRIAASLLGVNFIKKGWMRRAEFMKIRGKWIMTYSEGEYAIGYLQPKKDLDLDLSIRTEMAFTDLYGNIGKQITKSEEWKRKNLVANLPTAFDSTFWGNQAIISPTEKIKNIIQEIAAANHERAIQPASLQGWETLNRNYFVSWQHSDTVVLIPVIRSNWEDELTGGLLYRPATGNFVVESAIRLFKNSDTSSAPDRGFQQAGLLIRNASDSNGNFIFLSLGTGGNPNPKLFFKRTTNNKTKSVVSRKENMQGIMRIQRAGNMVTAWYKSQGAADFEKVGEFQLDWLGNDLQVGMAVCAVFSGDGPKMKPDMRAEFINFKIETQ